MKLNKLFLGFAVILGVLFTSCDTDNVGPVYNVSTPNISFEQGTMSVLTADASVEITVMLSRYGKSGSYTVHYTGATKSEGIFTDVNKGEVTFPDGLSRTSFTIKAENMEIAKSYTYTIVLSDEDIKTKDEIIGNPTTTTKITITRDYTWKSFGVGTYNSPDALEAKWTQEILQAEQNPNLYKLPGSKDSYDYDIQLLILDDGTVLVPFQKGWVLQDYEVYIGGNKDNNQFTESPTNIAGTYDKSKGVITLELVHYILSLPYNLGTFTDTFTFGKEGEEGGDDQGGEGTGGEGTGGEGGEGTGGEGTGGEGEGGEGTGGEGTGGEGA